MRKLFLPVLLCFALASCKWDNEQDLYPEETGGGTNCDGSTAITYSASIQPILSARCLSCHSASASSNLGGGVRLDSYQNVKVRADNGSLAGVVNHDSGYPQMPQGSSKLSSCQISLIEQWIAEGTLNN
ncbi:MULTISPECIES: hypothetical protein [unclassified Imperialibacter]|uniref:hypothetical protein n=1 Tax=unclassified Imperialibacter TaxID=2629706 RepID=UPI00125A3F52|nr:MULTISPECIES: hypothetical protein [unclassified Imperialibacter]CAD5267612.1 Cbb3-type cytochrome c oxidase subunit III [Imperialibacter sp. 75]CAD5279995.1 Cbb3-type cytochrome c oxidase subunit III [Imperialibacter sp. 89]VVT01186.1 conserved hypothetical protein [Imperialibacter sp. EC-SDR9]